MGDTTIDNVLDKIISSIRNWKFVKKEKPTTSRNEKPHKNIRDIEKKRKELIDLVEKVKREFHELTEAGDHEFKGLINNELKGLISERSENQSSGHEVIKEISSVSDVVDLSVTGLTKGNLESFWDTVKKFNNLTSLTVAMSVTEQSAFTLPDCGDLKNKLKRLRMEGKFPISSTSAQSYVGLNKLNEFTNLTDLTLVSHEPINIDSIPASEKLLCLRLYGVRNENICKIEAKQLKRLKKLVIGDMKNVETVQIGGAVIETLATLKLCKLPKLKELVCPNKKQTLLKWGNNTAERGSKEDQSLKTIFLRDIDSPKYKSSSLTIYRYDMNKQCYNEVIIKP